MAAIGGIYLFVTQYLQLVEGLSPIEAGVWLLPSATGLVLSSMLTPVLARRVRPSHVVVVGLTVSAAGFVVLTRMPGAGSGSLVIGFTLVYVGIAPLLVLGTDLVVGGAPTQKAGSAAAIAQTSTQLGVGLGIAILGSVGNAIYRAEMRDVVPTSTSAEAAAAARDSLAGAAAAAAGLPADSADRLRGGCRRRLCSRPRLRRYGRHGTGHRPRRGGRRPASSSAADCARRQPASRPRTSR